MVVLLDEKMIQYQNFGGFFFYPFDYGNFIRYLINNKTNGNVALGK